MHEDLREKAKERVRAKSDFVTTAITFLGISVVLGLLSFYLPPIAFWLLLPLPIFAMILGIMYVKIYGYNLFGTPSLAPLPWTGKNGKSKKRCTAWLRKRGTSKNPLRRMTCPKKIIWNSGNLIACNESGAPGMRILCEGSFAGN